MVVDTMVLAYAVLGEPTHGEESLRVLEEAPEVWAPDSIRPELTNVLWQWVRFRNVPLEVSIQALHYAEGFLGFLVSTDQLWEDALRLAVDSEQSAYDTLFVTLAARRGLKLVTYDKKLLTTFPNHTITASDYLASLA